MPNTNENHTESQTQSVAVPFNPFTHLTVEETAALAKSYNKQWRAANSINIALAMTEFGCGENEAIFYAALKADAQSIIDRETVSKAVDDITPQIRYVAFPKASEMALGLIEGFYTSLKPELRKTVGTRVRDWAHKEYVGETAKAVMDKVYAHLKITEKDWMR